MSYKSRGTSWPAERLSSHPEGSSSMRLTDRTVSYVCHVPSPLMKSHFALLPTWVAAFPKSKAITPALQWAGDDSCLWHVSDSSPAAWQRFRLALILQPMGNSLGELWMTVFSKWVTCVSLLGARCRTNLGIFVVADLSPRRPGSVHMGFLVDKVALGWGFRVSPCHYHSTVALHTHIIWRTNSVAAV
jgi:hypothetical protein